MSSGRDPGRRRMILAIVLAFLIAAALHAVLFSSGFYGISGDESGRTLDAIAWMRTGKPQSNVWLPLHRILVAAGLSLLNNCFVVPRILSFFFGLTSLLGIIVLAHELFHRRKATVLTAFLAAVFGPRVILSVVPLTELECMTFIVFTMIYYLRWIRTAEPSALLAASVYAVIGTTVRYEAWIFVFVLLLLLSFDSESRKTIFMKWWLAPLVIVITCAFPVCWIIDSYREYHVFMVFVSPQHKQYGTVDPYAFLKFLWRNPAAQFIAQNGVSLNLVGIFPVIRFIKTDKKLRRIILLPAIAVIIFGAAGLAGVKFTTHNPWRIAVLWSCLMIPFTAVWIIEQQERFQKNSRKAAVVLVIILMFLCQLAWMTENPVFTKTRYDAGIYLRTFVRPLLGPGDKILIDTRKWDYLDLLVVSNAPERFVLNSGPYPYKPEKNILDAAIPVDLRVPAAQRYRYLAFETPLSFDTCAEASEEKVFSNKEWTIYKINLLTASVPAEWPK
ncbi:MAG: glycosyltransferase family 39 protein [Bacteroidota bacterium]